MLEAGDDPAATASGSRGEIERLGQRVARITAEENFLQSGGNILDLGATAGGGAPAPTLRGAAAASAAAKAARLAAQGIVGESRGARACARRPDAIPGFRGP